jgi:hypothetical protein
VFDNDIVVAVAKSTAELRMPRNLFMGPENLESRATHL